MKINCLVPGSFDPITLGHIDIIRRCSKDYNKVIVMVGINSSKNYLFTDQERLKLARIACKPFKNVLVYSYKGLTVRFARLFRCKYIVKGIRNEEDVAYENGMKEINAQLDHKIKTIYLYSNEKYANISSTEVRNRLKNNQDISDLVDESIKDKIVRMWRAKNEKD